MVGKIVLDVGVRGKKVGGGEVVYIDGLEGSICIVLCVELVCGYEFLYVIIIYMCVVYIILFCCLEVIV